MENNEDNVLDMELEPETAYILGMFRQGNDEMARNPDDIRTADRLQKYVKGLSNYTKGAVIIDLATLCDLMAQAHTLRSLQEIEKGMTDAGMAEPTGQQVPEDGQGSDEPNP